MTSVRAAHAERPRFAGQAAVAGVGFTELTKRSGRSVLSLAVEACRNALGDAALDPREVDGMVSFSLFGDSVPCQAVATSLALGDLSYAADLNMGGQAPCLSVLNAAMAISSGLAGNVLVFRALNGRSGTRVGSTRFSGSTGQYRYPLGFSAYPQYIAMWARRYLIETGRPLEDLGWVAVRQREFAALNERAIRRSPLDIGAYLESPFVVDPFRVADCTAEVDGACAVLVTSLERARDLARPPAVIAGGAWATPSGSGLDIADAHGWPDMTRNYTSHLASRLWRSAGVGPADVDVAEIYDCFTSVVLFGLEGLGLAGRGEAGELFRSGVAGRGGRLPVNTNGGLLNEGYLHGMNTVAEAVAQVQGRCGERQVPGAESCVVTSGAMMDGSALVLTADR